MAAAILVTGGSGFVGRAVARALASNGQAVREAASQPRPGAVLVGPMHATTDWSDALPGCAAVVHLAARVHIPGKSAAADFDAFRATNRDGTLRLAAEAARYGVRRLVFMSTIKVNGEGQDATYAATDAPRPAGAYAVSKHEAEEGLKEIAARTGLEVVILRPPLVYGPGVKGNFRALMRLLARGLPLPLGAVRNRRSLIGLANLVSAIERALEHPAAPGRTYLVSDQHDLSTPELIEELARALGRPARLLPVPVPLLRLAGTLLGQTQPLQQLTGSLTVDSSPISHELGWRPVHSVKAGMAQTAEHFLRQQDSS